MKKSDDIVIKRNDVILKQYSSVEYLGCILDSTLSGEGMALKVLKKANGKLRYLHRHGKYLNTRLRRMLCNALIQPHFDYACSAWYPNLSKTLKEKLQVTQNKCILTCLFLVIRYKHLKKINWLPIWERVKQFIAVSVYKFSNSLAPKYMDDIFNKTQNRQRTRSADEFRISIPFRKHEYGKNCLSYLGATIWNNFETDVKKSKTCNSFKHKIKANFFKEIKKKEDNIYIY